MAAPAVEATIGAKHVRLFAKTLVCLAKIGQEVFLEAGRESLVMRVLNASHSAYAAVTLPRPFFDSYDPSAGPGAAGARKYQVRAKPLAAAFRGAAAVDRCVLHADEEMQRLVITQHCKRGSRKKFTIAFEDCDALEANFSTETPMKVLVKSKTMLDFLAHFHTGSAEEVSLVFTDSKAWLRTFTDEGSKTRSNAAKAIKTEIALDLKWFDEYLYPTEQPDDADNADNACNDAAGPPPEVSVTLSLRDLKSVASLGDVVGQPLSLHITRAGMPVVLMLRSGALYEAAFVIASILPPAPAATPATPSAVSTPTSTPARQTTAQVKRTPRSGASDMASPPDTKRARVSPMPSPAVSASRAAPPSPMLDDAQLITAGRSERDEELRQQQQQQEQQQQQQQQQHEARPYHGVMDGRLFMGDRPLMAADSDTEMSPPPSDTEDVPPSCPM
eukprot:m51a1_g14018 hypothetical protein (445) ;mRNA; r:1103476-1105039